MASIKILDVRYEIPTLQAVGCHGASGRQAIERSMQCLEGYLRCVAAQDGSSRRVPGIWQDWAPSLGANFRSHWGSLKSSWYFLCPRGHRHGVVGPARGVTMMKGGEVPAFCLVRPSDIAIMFER